MPKGRQVATFKTRRRWTIEDGRAAINAHAASGLSVRAFAIREGLDVQRLLRWRRRLDAEHERASPVAFVEVQPRRVEGVEIVLRSGRILRAAESIDVGVLTRIADALDKPEPC
jgi:transposase-like protein